MTDPAPHVRHVRIPPRESVTLEEDVRRGLSAEPRRLPFRLLYDPVGSELFLRITEQPEYYLPRAESGILEECAQELARACADDTALVELGSGHSVKTPLLLDAFRQVHPSVRYVAIDVSGSALKEMRRDLSARYPKLPILAMEAEYFDALEKLPVLVTGPRLVVWLGSSLGNFSPKEAAGFLHAVRGRLERADGLLLGVDLQKEPAVLRAAYDDVAGYTARFMGNVLERINRELGADFQGEHFEYRVEVPEDGSRVGMYLVSTRDQTVQVPGMGRYRFGVGDAIHMEDSWKLSPAQLEDVLEHAGFSVRESWTDPRGRFLVVHAAPVDQP